MIQHSDLSTCCTNGELGGDSLRGTDFSCHHHIYIDSGEETLIHTEPETFISRLKRPQAESDHRVPSHAEIENTWSYASISK
jgi:predicted transposase YbfD/YdcC